MTTQSARHLAVSDTQFFMLGGIICKMLSMAAEADLETATHQVSLLQAEIAASQHQGQLFSQVVVDVRNLLLRRAMCWQISCLKDKNLPCELMRQPIWYLQELAGLKDQLAGPALSLCHGVDKMSLEMAVMERERQVQAARVKELQLENERLVKERRQLEEQVDKERELRARDEDMAKEQERAREQAERDRRREREKQREEDDRQKEMERREVELVRENMRAEERARDAAKHASDLERVTETIHERNSKEKAELERCVASRDEQMAALEVQLRDERQRREALEEEHGCCLRAAKAREGEAERLEKARADLEAKLLKVRAGYEDEMTKLRDSLAARQAQYDALREEHDACSRNMQTCKDAWAVRDGERAKIAEEKEALALTLGLLRQQHAAATLDLGRRDADISKLKTSLSDLERSVASRDEQMAALVAQLRDEKQRREALEEEQARCLRAAKAREGEAERLEKARADLEVKLRDEKQQREALEEEHGCCLRAAKAREGEAERLEKARADHEAKLLKVRAGYEDEMTKLRDSLAAFQARYDALREELDACGADLSASRAESAGLEQLEAEMTSLKSEQSKWTQDRAAWELERASWKTLEAEREAEREEQRIESAREIAQAKDSCAQEIASCNVLRCTLLFFAPLLFYERQAYTVLYACPGAGSIARKCLHY